MNDYTIPVVIPAYEPDVSFIEFCWKLKEKGFLNVVILDDGSGEAYRPIFAAVEKLGFQVFAHAINLGKGRALKDAFNYVLYMYPDIVGIVTADSDGQHKPEDILKCMEALRKNPSSLILGCREFQGSQVPWKSRIGNELTKKVFRFLCGITVSDTQTGLRGMPTALVKRVLKIKGEGFDFETNVLLEAHGGFDFIEVPIHTVYESKEKHKTHFNPLRDSVMIYKLIFSYALSSLLSVAVDFSVFGLAEGAGSGIWLATALGRISSAIVNFNINKKMVFHSKGNMHKQLAGYILLLCASGALSAASIYLLSKNWSDKILLLKAIVEGCLFFANYYIQRAVIFQKGRREAE